MELCQARKDQGVNLIPNSAVAVDNAWLRSYKSESEKKQNKHEIAVAAATTATADAAVAAAQAAVRLATHERSTLCSGGR